MNVVRSTLLILAVFAGALGAQRPDSARTALPQIARIPRDSLIPPLTPRKAFLYSFLVPGYSQSVLGRHKTASAFILVEAISFAMIRESAADLHEARRLQNDSLVIAYDAAGGATLHAGQFGAKEVKTRQAHVEDWIALLVANHLFAGADAFVAANLWDVRARLGLRNTPNGTMLTASVNLP